ncbi:unnamed protein product [Sphagnum tenellum]
MHSSRSLAPTASRAALQETTVASSCVPSSIPQSVQVTKRDEKNLPKLVRHYNKKSFLLDSICFKKLGNWGRRTQTSLNRGGEHYAPSTQIPKRRWPGEERHLYFRRESSRRGRSKEGDDDSLVVRTQDGFFRPLTIFRI